MHFPDGDIQDFATFTKSYDHVTHLFFDQRHTIRSIDLINETDSKAGVQLVVRWQSRFWEPPAATSQRIDAEVSQKWTVGRCSPEENAFNLEIVDYYVSGDFTYAPGSAVLPPSPRLLAKIRR
jgi:hypothetical protein